ncbi:MAG: hypothetical protein WBA31_04375 [Candidatus Dormiibacterota bacterium]
MSAFGAVPGLTIMTLAAVMLLAGGYLGAATYVGFSTDGQHAWKRVAIPVVFLFALTVAFALISAIAENQFVNRVTGG